MDATADVVLIECWYGGQCAGDHFPFYFVSSKKQFSFSVAEIISMQHISTVFIVR
jgi:hypothetical protein